jgi:predicted deacetylase
MILGGCETYQLILQNVEHVRPPHDPKVQKTVLAIIDEFFRSNMKVLLYICDTSDGKEDSRNRLFLRWFEKYAEPGRFTICNAHANVEGEVVYAAIIVENRNPKLKEIMEDFEEAAAVLTDKP